MPLSKSLLDINPKYCPQVHVVALHVQLPPWQLSLPWCNEAGLYCAHFLLQPDEYMGPDMVGDLHSPHIVHATSWNPGPNIAGTKWQCFDWILNY